MNCKAEKPGFSEQLQINLLVCDNPFFGNAGVGIELHADLHHLAPLCLIRKGIALLVYLLQSLAGSAIHFS